MKRAAHLLKINPIIVKEVRSRMRGARAFITLTIILLVMGAVMYGMLQIFLANSRYSTVLSPQIGQAMFAALAFLELFMISAITPAVTAGAISSEKEKQTYEMLMATPMSPASVLWGKLVSALSYVMLLLFAGIPLASLVFIFGGVAPADMVKALLVLVTVAVTFGILGLFMSALFGRTGRATVASFLVVVFLMVGPLFAAILSAALRGGAEPPRWLLAPSPISALSAALASSMGQNGIGGMFWALGGLFNMGVTPVSQVSVPRPLYHYSLPLYALISLVLYLLTTRLVQPTRRWRIPRRELLTGLGLLALLVGGIAAAYFASARRYEWNRAPVTDMTGGNIAPVQAFPQPVVGMAYPVMVATPTPVLEARNTATPIGPGPTPTPAAVAGLASLGDEAQAQIYALIARQLFSVDNTFNGKNPGWTTIYLVAETNDSVGDPNMPQNAPVSISLAVRERVAALLGDLGVTITWVDKQEEIPVSSTDGSIEGGKGARVTFGNIYAQEDKAVRLSASLYFGNVGGTGKTYIIAPDGDGWKIIGTTGIEWIS